MGQSRQLVQPGSQRICCALWAALTRTYPFHTSYAAFFPAMQLVTLPMQVLSRISVGEASAKAAGDICVLSPGSEL